MKGNYIKCAFLTIIVFLGFVDNLEILVVFPSLTISHYLSFKPMFSELANRGHKLTILNFFGSNSSSESNIKLIDLSDDTIFQNAMSIDQIRGNRDQMYTEPILLGHKLSELRCSRFMQSDNLKNFLRETHAFDIIVLELFVTNCYYGLAERYSAPLIGLSSTDFLPWMYQWFGCPENPSYIPVLFMDYADKLTFLQRVENTLMLIYSKLYHYYYIGPSGNEYSKKYLGVDLYEGGDILYNISLLLINRHYSFHTPKPLTPNVIEVGGIHIQPPKTLPQELEKIVNGSKHGLIFMSMGSTLKGSTFPETQRKLFLKVFSQLNQTIIWKWENDTMEDLPANVKILRWLPQLDLLCHPNVKLFITHGGLLGTQEGAYCAIPMLILPQFADQHYNAAVLKKSGATLSLKLRSATEEDLIQAIHELLKPEFSKNAKALSERFKDRPMSPMDTAIYWIEYVARHKGAPFMKSAVTDMPFYQSLLLDVIAFLTLLATILISSLYFTVHFIVRLCRFKSKLKVKTN